MTKQILEAIDKQLKSIDERAVSEDACASVCEAQTMASILRTYADAAEALASYITLAQDDEDDILQARAEYVEAVAKAHSVFTSEL